MTAEDGLVLGVQLEVVLGQGPQLQLPVGELATVAELAPGREDHDQDQHQEKKQEKAKAVQIKKKSLLEKVKR